MGKKDSNVDYASFAEKRIHVKGRTPEQVLHLALRDAKEWKEYEKAMEQDGVIRPKKLARVIVLFQYETLEVDNTKTTGIGYYTSSKLSLYELLGIMEEAKLTIYDYNSFDTEEE